MAFDAMLNFNRPVTLKALTRTRPLVSLCETELKINLFQGVNGNAR